MLRKNVFSGLLLTLLISPIACMDVSPPVVVEVDESELLHSIVLPFQKAVYGVGDSDSIGVTVRLVSGDTIVPDPGSLSWRITPVQSAVTVDSTGKLAVNAFYADPGRRGLNLIATYTTGTVTRADTGIVFITDKSYEIETFSLTSLDSARGSMLFYTMLFQGSRDGVPHFDLQIRDRNGDVPAGLDISRQLEQFLSSTETGVRMPNVLDLQIFEEGFILVNGFAPVGGRYWIGIGGYLYGKHFKDSVEFTQLAQAELMLTVAEDNGRLSVTSGVEGAVIQPCANIIGQNMTSDTIFIELSEPEPQLSCGGISLPAGPIAIPPGLGLNGKIAYKDGTVVTWRAYKKGAPNVSVGNGSFEFRSVN